MGPRRSECRRWRGREATRPSVQHDHPPGGGWGGEFLSAGGCDAVRFALGAPRTHPPPASSPARQRPGIAAPHISMGEGSPREGATRSVSAAPASPTSLPGPRLVHAPRGGPRQAAIVLGRRRRRRGITALQQDGNPGTHPLISTATPLPVSDPPRRPPTASFNLEIPAVARGHQRPQRPPHAVATSRARTSEWTVVDSTPTKTTRQGRCQS